MVGQYCIVRVLLCNIVGCSHRNRYNVRCSTRSTWFLAGEDRVSFFALSAMLRLLDPECSSVKQRIRLFVNGKGTLNVHFPGLMKKNHEILSLLAKNFLMLPVKSLVKHNLLLLLTD